MKYWLIADPHFGHEKVIQYCDRPFHNAEEMNETIIRNWNNVVGKEDTVFVLGDYSFGRELAREITPKLNGKKILIKGNHDRYPNRFYRDCGFEEVSKYPIIFGFYMLSHEPLQLSETTPYFNYYGHVHNDAKYADNNTSRCVSAERIAYTPILMCETDSHGNIVERGDGNDS